MKNRISVVTKLLHARFINKLIIAIINFSVFSFIFLNMLPGGGGFVFDIVDLGHFFSSHHMFEYASHHDFQFGVDIIDNVGPYGYLHYPFTYAGGVFWGKLIWFTVLCFIYAYSATLLIRSIQPLYANLF